jgi:thiol-disulfide isomerase/thioredoxin
MTRSRRFLLFGRSIAAFAMIVFATYATMIPIGAVTSVSGSAANAQTLAPIEIGTLAPDVAFAAVDGTERWLSEFRGQPVMLWFYASWCPTCQVGTVAVAEKLDRLKQAGIQIIQLQLYNNLGAPGPSVEDFAAQYARSVPRSSNWLWGEASLVASYTYDPSGYPDIYFLIGRDGIVQEIAPAPHVTMNIILEFAESAKVNG